MLSWNNDSFWRFKFDKICLSAVNSWNTTDQGVPRIKVLLPYSCVFAKCNYRVLVRVCVCVCVSAFVHDNLKSNWSRNMKLENIVIGLYENISDKFDIGHCRTTIQTIRPHNLTLAQASKLILSMYVFLIYKFYKYRQAWMSLRIPREC